MAAISSTIAAVTAIAGAVSAGYSIYQGQQQRKEAKKEQKKQQKEQKKQQEAINAEKKKAESDRMNLLSQQRYQMGLDSDYSTSSTSSVGRGLTTGKSTLG